MTHREAPARDRPRRGPGTAARRGTGWRGEPLGDCERQVLEAFYGADLADVRLHAGRLARAVNRLLGARAVTFGRRVLFSPAGWRTCRTGGCRGIELLGHEAAHVLQYRHQGLVRMLAGYLASYARSRARGAGHAVAYRCVPYEVEAWAASDRLAELLARLPDLAERVRAGGPPTAGELGELAARGRGIRPPAREPW